MTVNLLFNNNITNFSLIANEPKDNTEVQRAWIPARDSGLTHVYKNLEKNE